MLCALASLFSFEIDGEELYVHVLIASGDSLMLDSVTFDLVGKEVESLSTPVKVTIDTTYADIKYLTKERQQYADRWIEHRLFLKDMHLSEVDEWYYRLNNLEVMMHKKSGGGELIEREIHYGRFLLNSNGEERYTTSNITKFDAVALTIDGFEGTYSGTFSLLAHEGKIGIVQKVPFEEYVIGVVASEIGDFAPDEALKAQAIAARTKTIRTLMHPKVITLYFDFCNTTTTQVYRGTDKVRANIREAVEATKSEVLTYNDTIIDALFSSNCGGVTESNNNVWNGDPIPYLQSVVDMKAAGKYNLRSESGVKNWIDSKTTPKTKQKLASWQRKYFHWVRHVRVEDVKAKTGLDRVKNIKVLKRGDSGRILQLEISGNEKIVLKNQSEIRATFGGLPSSMCYFERTKSGFKVIGRGYGHGVGMCQSGAIVKAFQGWDYKKILMHFYQNAKIDTIKILDIYKK